MGYHSLLKTSKVSTFPPFSHSGPFTQPAFLSREKLLPVLCPSSAQKPLTEQSPHQESQESQALLTQAWLNDSRRVAYHSALSFLCRIGQVVPAHEVQAR